MRFPGPGAGTTALLRQYSGIPKSQAERSDEVDAFREFILGHVKRNSIRSVQCMLLWSEWVRFCRKKLQDNPRVILENRFRDLMTVKFGLRITAEDIRGPVYEGIKFIP